MIRVIKNHDDLGVCVRVEYPLFNYCFTIDLGLKGLIEKPIETEDIEINGFDALGFLEHHVCTFLESYDRVSDVEIIGAEIYGTDRCNLKSMVKHTVCVPYAELETIGSLRVENEWEWHLDHPAMVFVSDLWASEDNELGFKMGSVEYCTVLHPS